MAGYIGKVQITENTANAVLISSTMYGICRTDNDVAAKTVISTDDNSGSFINNNYDNLTPGTTIHVKFINGNILSTNLTLRVGSTSACPIDGKCICDANNIISFTLDENGHWVVNDNVDTQLNFINNNYNAETNKIATEADLLALNLHEAAHKDVDTSINITNNTSENLPTTAAVAAYVQEQTGGLSGLTGAMHFRGVANPLPNATSQSTFNSYESGDVIVSGNNKEYVYLKAATAAESEWIELGDEGSYALKSNTATVIGLQQNSFTTNTLPHLDIDTVSVPNVISAGSAATLETDTYTIPNVTAVNQPTTMSVTNGVLNITPGVAATFGTSFTVGSVRSFETNTPAQLGTPFSIGSSSNWSAGTQVALQTQATTVVVPDSNS